jgi:O-antigen/teichoic acid export membrane protein
MRPRVSLPGTLNESVRPLIKPLALLLSGQVIAAALGLLLGKATAIYIEPDELGKYNLAFSGLNLAHVLLVVPILQSFKASQTQVGVRPAFTYYWRLLVYVYGATLLALWVSGYVLDQVGLTLLIGVAAVGQGVYAGSTDFLNLSGRRRLYTALQIGYAAVNLLLFGLLVVLCQQSSAVALWGCLALTNGCFALLTFSLAIPIAQSTDAPDTPSAAGPTWDSFVQYATPLIRLAAWGWVLNYGDRYIIGLYLTEADVGQYSVGYSLGAKLVILVAPFVAHSTQQIYAMRAGGASIHATWPAQRNYLIAYTTIALCLCTGYYLLRNPLGTLLLSNQYRQAFQIGPLVAFGYLFLTLIHLLEVQWYAYGLTKLIYRTTLVGAVANVLLNLLLIPRFGVYGAAYACVGGFLGQFLLACYFYRNNLRQADAIPVYQ